jgi:hypothetical protein
MEEAGELDSKSVLYTNADVSVTERAVGTQEFETFVMDTFKLLTNFERKKMGGWSTLEVFCRLDVGLFLKGDGNLGYFVNEVERSLTTGLWTRNLDVDYNILAATFAKALARWSENLPFHSC